MFHTTAPPKAAQTLSKTALDYSIDAIALGAGGYGSSKLLKSATTTTT